MTSRAARMRIQSKARLVNVEPLTRLSAIISRQGLDEVPLGDYLTKEWLPGVSLEVEASTFTNLRYHCNAYIIPNLGDMPVCDIDRETLRRLYQQLLHTPRSRGEGFLSKTTCISVHATLCWALQRLSESGRIIANPAWGARPRVKKSEMFEPTVWSPEELAHFLDHVSTDRLHALWNVLALTGMRRGEALALKWGDISRDHQLLAIKRGMTRAGGRVYISAPKARQARRIDLLPATVTALRKHRRKETQRTKGLGRQLNGSMFIFQRPHGGLLSPSSVTQAFLKLSNEADLPRIRLHDLRHTHATHMLEAGANFKAVQERLGHSDPIVTINSYVHVMPTIQAEAIRSLKAFYGKTVPTQ